MDEAAYADVQVDDDKFLGTSLRALAAVHHVVPADLSGCEHMGGWLVEPQTASCR
jgi:hypothetical protein